jgi:hypothetical protein
LPEIVQEIGAAAGLAAVVGLAVLSALYFSQARDVKRLREWAGRAPERAETAAAPVPGRVVATPQAPKPATPSPPAAPTGPPTVPGRPAVPAAAAAVGAGPATATQSPPAAAAAATEAAKAGGPATPAGNAAQAADAKPAVEDAKPDDGASAKEAEGEKPADGAEKPADGDAKPPATEATAAAPTASPPTSPPVPARPVPTPPASRPASPPTPSPRAPLRPSVSSRPSPQSTQIIRPSAEPWYRRIGTRYVALVLVGLVVLGGGAAYGVSQLAGGDSGNDSSDASLNGNDSDGGASKPKHKAAVNPASVTVAVLNGTTVPGLAATLSDQIGAAGFKIGTITNFSDQQLAESVVQYAPGHAAEARAVSRRVGIGQREPVSQSSQALAGDATVIVIAGADKAP